MTPGWVLHSRAYRETSKLVELLTPDGRVRCMARGKKVSGSLQTFLPLYFEFGSARELVPIKSAEPVGPGILLSGRELVLGLYLNELLVRLLPEGMPCEDLHGHYGRAVSRLSEGERALRFFENRLLDALGFGLDWPILDPSGHYLVHPESGPRRAVESPNTFKGDLLNTVAAEDWTGKPALAAAKRINRARLQVLLGTKPLKTRDLF